MPACLMQDALAKLQAGRTTLVIAHRLSTIRDASSIAVVQVRGQLGKGWHKLPCSRTISKLAWCWLTAWPRQSAHGKAWRGGWGHCRCCMPAGEMPEACTMLP